MKVLITGGAGFVGSHFANRMITNGDEILVIDNLATGRRDNIADIPNLRFVEDTIVD